MRFGEHFLEELKARIRPSDVVGRHVKLKRQGREFSGLSPFTNEKTPSNVSKYFAADLIRNA